MSVEVTKKSAHSIHARLIWTDHNGVRTEGPLMGQDIHDSEMTDGMLKHFVQTLLRVSKLPTQNNE